MNSPDNNSNQNSDKSSVKHDELRQQLWEMAYGLLEPEAEAELRAQIKSDPAIARLYSEVRLQSDLVGVAARVNDASLHIAAGPDAKVTKVDPRSRLKHPSRTMPAVEAKSWSTNWLAVGGTVALLVLLAFGLYQPQVTKSSVAQAEYFFTSISAPANTPAGVSQTVEVKTSSVDERGRPAAVALRVVNDEGKETFRKQLRTNDEGLGFVELPGSVVRPGARLEAIADDEASRERAGAVVSAALKVTEEPRRTVVLLQSPRAKAGDKVEFSEVDVKLFSKQTMLSTTDELMVEGRDGQRIVEPKWRKDEGAGVISGEFQLPPDPSLDVRGLAFRRQSNAAALKQDQAEKAQGGFGGKAEAASDRQELALNPSGGAGQANGAVGGVGGGGLQRGGAKPRTFSKSGTAGPGDEPLPEALAGGGGNPAPRIARSMAAAPADAVTQNAPAPPAPLSAAAGAPAGPEANRKNAANQLADKVVDGNQVANPTTADRPGAVNEPTTAASEMKPGNALTKDGRFVDRARDEKQSLENKFYAQETQHDSFGARVMDRENSGAAAVDGRELRQLQIPAQLLGKRALLVARQHGVPVVRREIASLQEADHFVELPPEISGRVDIELYRPDDSKRPVYQQQIVRAAARSLHFDVQGLQDKYAPGEKVQLQVGVHDEHGNPVAATVAVRVWNDVAVREIKTPLLLVDALNQRASFAGDAATLAAALPQVAMARGIPARETRGEAETPALQATAPPTAAPAEVAIAPAAPSELKRVTEQEELRRGAGKKGLGAELATEPALAEVHKSLEDAAALEDMTDISFVDQNVVADNRAVVQQEYAAAVAATQAQRFERVQWFGRLLLWAGAGLMLLIAALLIARRPLNTAVWIPAVGIAALSLALGLSWFVPPQPAGWELARVENSTGVATNQEVQIEMAPAPMADLAPQRTLEDQDAVPSPVLPGNSQAGEGGGGGAGFAPGAMPAQPAKPGLAMRVKIDPQRQQGADRDLAKEQETEQLAAQEKLAEAKKAAASDEPGRAPAAKPGEAIDSFQQEGGRAQLERAAGVANRGESAAPDAIYWRPLSLVGSDGTFTIEFTMPEVESEYRLLLDAIGNGRVGGQQQLLICTEKP